MTLEELWELFPIFLVPHKSIWIKNFNEEKAYLKKLLKDFKQLKIEHIGSTAIKNIYAKDIVDILLLVNTGEFQEIIGCLNKNKYILMNKTESKASLNKGYTINGFADKVFHIHVRCNNDLSELHFRNYLNEHFDVAKAYEKLKLELWKKYEHNRDEYTNAKTNFINEITLKAKKEYINRY